MGMFDTIIFDCFYCHQETSVQTKLTSNPSCSLLKIGDYLSDRIRDGILLLKDSCQHCNKENAILIKNNLLREIVDPKKANLEEKAFGKIEIIAKWLQSEETNKKLTD